MATRRWMTPASSSLLDAAPAGRGRQPHLLADVGHRPRAVLLQDLQNLDVHLVEHGQPPGSDAGEALGQLEVFSTCRREWLGIAVLLLRQASVSIAIFSWVAISSAHPFRHEPPRAPGNEQDRSHYAALCRDGRAAARRLRASCRARLQVDPVQPAGRRVAGPPDQPAGGATCGATPASASATSPPPRPRRSPIAWSGDGESADASSRARCWRTAPRACARRSRGPRRQRAASPSMPCCRSSLPPASTSSRSATSSRNSTIPPIRPHPAGARRQRRRLTLRVRQ